MEIMLVTLAESASIDQATNRLSIFNIIEEINSPTFPTVIPIAVVLFMLRRKESEPNTKLVNVRCMLNKKIQLFDGAVNVSFQGKLQMRTLAHLQNFVVPEPGELVLTLSSDSRDIGAWKLPVIQVGQTALKVERAPQGAPAPNFIAAPAKGNRAKKKAARRK